jgi:hypothetical protein
MKKWLRRLSNKQGEVVDGHNEPTEPLPRLILPAVPDVPFAPVFPAHVTDVPTRPLTPPDTASQAPQFQQSPLSSSPYSPPVQSYPYLPATPIQQEVKLRLARVSWIGRVRLPVPLMVGLCFVTMQFLLLLRLVVLFMPVGTENAWTGVIVAVSDLFIWPFRLLLQQAALPTLVDIAVSILLAIGVYGFISRILVHLLKIILRRRNIAPKS